ncbi:MAG: hypothetical protein ACLQU4_13920, partial [Limisphaerales bacterium]
TLALKAALCLFRFAFISLLFLIYSRPAKVELNQWSKNRGPAQMLDTAQDPMRTIIAISGLAGLRTAEIFRLTWEEVFRVPDHIEITAGKAKN